MRHDRDQINLIEGEYMLQGVFRGQRVLSFVWLAWLGLCGNIYRADVDKWSGDFRRAALI